MAVTTIPWEQSTMLRVWAAILLWSTVVAMLCPFVDPFHRQKPFVDFSDPHRHVSQHAFYGTPLAVRSPARRSLGAPRCREEGLRRVREGSWRRSRNGLGGCAIFLLLVHLSCNTFRALYTSNSTTVDNELMSM
uniref:Putative secreted peptide n=1 Tax=Anopheles braziliensis TaxID=58242 RepID=A0A2M3ZRT5_9DIPT